MENYCKTCKHEGEEIGVCSTCFYNHILDERDIPPTEYEKKPSNGDLIRAMPDEELAEFFAQQKYRNPVFDDWLPLCNHVMGPRTCLGDGCEKCWLDWLKQEAT